MLFMPCVSMFVRVCSRFSLSIFISSMCLFLFRVCVHMLVPTMCVRRFIVMVCLSLRMHVPPMETHSVRVPLSQSGLFLSSLAPHHARAQKHAALSLWILLPYSRFFSLPPLFFLSHVLRAASFDLSVCSCHDS